MTDLKLYSEELPEIVEPAPIDARSVEGLVESLQKAIGRRVFLADAAMPDDETARRLTSIPVPTQLCKRKYHVCVSAPLKEAERRDAPLKRREAVKLIEGVAGLLGELLDTQVALWQREAELAAGVPLTPRRDGEEHLATRLEAVLRAGVDSVNADAAALYLLNDATSELKMRANVGLGKHRLVEPARPLEGALADLEAMLGHAVVLEEAAMMNYWRAPEQYASAVCVPISSATTILGTLWLFCRRPRDFTDREQNLVEVTADRIAAELEREMLVEEGTHGARLKHELERAARVQQNQLPTISPMVEGWQLSAWTDSAHRLGGDFYDWFTRDDGRLAVVIGDALEDGGVAAALSASAVKSSIRSHGQYESWPSRVLDRVNLTCWTASAGDQFASVFYGLLDVDEGKLRYAAAGGVGVVHVHEGGCTVLPQNAPSLGTSAETTYPQREIVVRPGDQLVLFSEGLYQALQSAEHSLRDGALAEKIASCRGCKAERVVELIRRHVDETLPGANQIDRTAVVLTRTSP